MRRRIRRLLVPVRKQVRKLRNATKKVRLPGGEGARLYDVLRMLYRAVAFEGFDLRAYAIAFNFFLAFFPALLFVLTLLNQLALPGLAQQLVLTLSTVLPEATLELVAETIARPAENGRGTLTFTALLALFFARRGVLVLMQAFEKFDANLFRRRPWWHKQLLAIGLLLGLVLVTLVGFGIRLGMLRLANWLIENQGLPVGIQTPLIVLDYLLLFALLVLVVSSIYRIASSLERSWAWLNPGGIAGAVLLTLAQVLLQVYFDSFANYNRLFGGLTAIMVLLVWFYWLSVVLLLGFELNVSIRRAGLLARGRTR